MQRHSNVQISSLIVLLGILTIIIQFAAYYFFVSIAAILGISCLISLLCCHILLEQSATYESCLVFSILTLFISIVITFLSFGNDSSILPYSNTMYAIIAVNLLLPSVHCFIRYMLDYGTRLEDYSLYFRDSSIVFGIFYLGILAYGCFAGHAFVWAYPMDLKAVNVTPFQIISSQIEDYLYGQYQLKDILTYLSGHILAFLPYGFYITLLLRRQSKPVRFSALLFLPFTIEILQYFIVPNRCDIDDLIYALIGGLLGSVIYYLMNLIFRSFSGKDFLAKENEYGFSSSPLHF